MNAARARAAQIARRKSSIRSQRGRAGLTSLFGRGGYEAARSDLRELMGWTPSLGSADSDTLGDLPALRARSADAERNMPLAGGAILTQLDNVVGGGMTASPEIDREFLGLSDEEAEQWEASAERIMTAQTATTRFDVTRRLTFAQMQRVALRTVLSRGDAFAIRRYVARPGDVLALKIQLLEADRCTNPPGYLNSAQLRDGVAFDTHGAPSHYWFASHHPYELGLSRAIPTFTSMPAYGPESGEPMVLHIFEQLRPEQSRGVPYLAPVLRQLKQLDRYTDSELAAAVIASFFTVFLKRSGAIDDGAGLEDLTDPMTRELATAANEIKLGQGAIVGLEDGEDITIADPKRPNAQFSPFVLAVTRMLGVGLGIPHELLIKHFTASYSASRAALIEAWRAFEARQDWLVSSFCQPVYEWVIAEAVSRGLLNAPGFFEDPLVRRAYLGATWNGPTMGQLDEAREVNAATQRVEQLFSDRTTEAARLTGKPFSRIIAQQKKEKRAMDNAGLVPGERAKVEPSDTPENSPVPPPQEAAYAT